MSDIELGQLRAENARLVKDLESARKEAAKYRTDRSGKVKTAEGQVTELQAELEKLKKEHGKALKQIDEMPKQVAEENVKLKAEIRSGKYRQEFDRIAKEAKADPRALDALWRLADVNTDADQIDAEVLKGTVVKALDANPFMKEMTAPRQPQPGPGGGQGGKASQAPGSFRMSAEQQRDPIFMAQNRDAIHAAAKSGTLTIDRPQHQQFFEE